MKLALLPAALAVLGAWSAPADALTFGDSVKPLGAMETVLAGPVCDSGGSDVGAYPDTPAHAFRGSAPAEVQLTFAAAGARRMTGPTLDSVVLEQPCRTTYASHASTDPATYANTDGEWLSVPYKLGDPSSQDVYALIHNEYRGGTFGNCTTGSNADCWLASTTYAMSNDNGASYAQDGSHQPPAHLVAALPFQYDYLRDHGQFGFAEPANVVRNPADGYFYTAMAVRTRGNYANPQKAGVCIMQADRLGADPAAWRPWDGTTVPGTGSRFGRTWLNPYTTPVNPADTAALTPHTCAIASPSTLAAFVPRSLTFDRFLGKWMLVGTGSQGQRGVYYSLSDDLVNWSSQELVMAIPDAPIAPDPASQANCTGTNDPHWPGYAYSSVLDPSDPSVNFDQPGRTPYLYMTRFNRVVWVPPAAGVPDGTCVPDASRDLVRVPIMFLPGYPRPKGATPLRAALVLAFEQCASPNREHAPPLATGSCYPPQQASRRLTIGTVSANGQSPNSIGAIRYDVVPGDVRIAVSTTDVRTASDLSDYTGELEADQSLRITDAQSGSAPDDSGTTQDLVFPVPVGCTATADVTIGSTCAIATSANAIVPGAAMAGGRAIWQLGDLRLYDGGSTSTAGAADASLFEHQGVFVP
jgi:hypothetical protein